MFFKKKRIRELLEDDFSQREPTQLLDECAYLYNAFDNALLSNPERDRLLKDLFWKCYKVLCKWHKEGKISIYAGECDFEYFHTLLYNDGPEFAVFIIFTTDNINFYEAGVCIRGTPLLRKINLRSKDAQDTISYICKSENGIGMYFGDANERRAEAFIKKYGFAFNKIPKADIIQLLEKELADYQEGSSEYIRVLCGYLYCIGDATDVPLIENAKYSISMDVGCMIDEEWIDSLKNGGIATDNTRSRSAIIEDFVGELQHRTEADHGKSETGKQS